MLDEGTVSLGFDLRLRGGGTLDSVHLADPSLNARGWNVTDEDLARVRREIDAWMRQRFGSKSVSFAEDGSRAADPDTLL